MRAKRGNLPDRAKVLEIASCLAMTVVLQERSDVAISGRIHGTWSALAYVKEYVMKRQPAVYLLTNKPDGTLYTGVTSDLPKRIWQHRDKTTKGFTARYNLTRLVYFELSEDMYQAITREKQIKAGSREAKIKLLEKANPDWRDLYPEMAN